MLNAINPLSKVVFVDRIFKFVNLNLSRIIKLSLTNQNFREVAVDYSVKGWNEITEQLNNIQFENNQLSKSLVDFPWVVNRLNIPVDKFLNNFLDSNLEIIKKALLLCLEINDFDSGLYDKFIIRIIGRFRYNVVEFLLSNGADPSFTLKELIYFPSISKESRRVLKQMVLHIMENFRNEVQIPFYLFQSIKKNKTNLISLADLYFLIFSQNSNDNLKMKYYLDEMGDIDTIGPNGNTAINYFSGNGNQIIVQYLIDRGADVNFQEKYYGYSPLMRAVVSNDIDCVECLLLNHANPDLLDKSGCTSLHWAVSLKNYDLSIIRKIFWANPENLYVKDNDNRSVKDWAQDDIVIHALEELEKEYLNSAKNKNRKKP